MKLVTWNLQNGNLPDGITGTIDPLFLDDVDLMVLTGCRDAAIPKSFFSKIGLQHLAFWMPTAEPTGVLIASREPLLNLTSNQGSLPEQIWLEVYLPEHQLTVLGIDTSETMDLQKKADFWQQLSKYAEAQADTKTMMIGNFSMRADNLGMIFNFKHYFQNISSLGWIDAWRYFHPISYEKTWFSNAKKGLRLDFIILSPPLQELLANAYHAQILHDRQYAKSRPRVLIAELE
jgi:exonuclease III